MGKIKLHLKSSDFVGAELARVDILIDGTVVESNLTLALTDTIKEYPVAAGAHTVNISLLNGRAIDVNGDGEFDHDVPGECLYALVPNVDVSSDGTTYNHTVIPFAGQFGTNAITGTTYTIAKPISVANAFALSDLGISFTV